MSMAFRLLLRARETLYREGVLATRRLNHPVVSVGNLTVGGTGKTPLVITLADKFRTLGYKPVILSRGYMRKSRDVIIVGSSWEEAGDEPFLMKRRLCDVSVVVGADRHKAGILAERNELGNLFILDDGFQHRRLYREVDIVTINPAEWRDGEALLPTGPWREPKTAIQRAHVACVLEMPGVSLPSLPIPAVRVQTRIEGIYKDEIAVSPHELRGREIVAFAGIAGPERFFASLESLGLSLKQRIVFRDHHPFSKQDIERLKGDVLITTEKDAVRLQGLGTREFFHLRISANISEFERLLEIVLPRLSTT